MTAEPDEYELARRARDGDREALSELVERLRLRLFALAYAEVRHYEDAQDVVASALLRICRHVGEMREPERVRSWMHAVVRNEARRRLRSRSEAPVSLADVEEASGAESAPSPLRLDIELALRKLPRDEARALALFYLSRVPIREIARLTDRPEGTIKRWLHMGRRHLATAMEGYAPMTPAPTTNASPAALSAAIICNEFDPTLLKDDHPLAAPKSRRQLIRALEEAGFSDVTAFEDVAHLVQRAEREWPLASELKGKRFILLDEWIGGRSAFEIHAVLKAAPDLQDSLFGLLVSSAADVTVSAAWCAGFELLLTKPFNVEELTRFCGSIRAKLEQQDAAHTVQENQQGE